MKYMLLIYSDENAMGEPSPEEMAEVLAVWNAYGTEMADAGVLIAGEGLQPTMTATTVSMQNGEHITTHGPFAETKEQLGGFYMIDCANLDEAIAWAAKNPGVQYGKIEVRPVMDYGN